MGAERFNTHHGAAGSGHGGQFVPADSGGPGGGKKAAPAGAAHDKPGHGHGGREQLLAQAREDRAEADRLERQLQALEHQHEQAAAAARQSARQAAAAKKAGHVVHHHHHATMHRHHHHHARSLAQRITSLKGRIRDLRQHAAALTAKAHAMRAAGEVTNPEGTARLHEYWVHGPGAAKIRWGEPHDFDRCVLHLGKYARDPEGLCANLHHAALGVWPGQEHGGKGRSMSKKPYGDVKYADPKNGKYPIDTAAHAKAAWSYINQADNAAQYPVNGVTLTEVKNRIRAACRRFGITISEDNSDAAAGEYRMVEFDVGDARADGDGLTFEGYAAVYGHRTRIADAYEDFDEQIMPGAFRSVTDGGRYPVLMFEHGRHPLIGTLPLGRITGARDDSRGLWIEARLTDNWLIQPVRDAIADKAITGMSFRFSVNGEDGQAWEKRSGEPDLRSLLDLDVPELGPVVFPQYEPTTAGVRSALDSLPVIGRPPAGAGAASDRAGDALACAEPDPVLSVRFRRDGEALALRGIEGVRIP